MKALCRLLRRLFLLVSVLTASVGLGQQIPKTTVNDVVYRADGNPAQGTLLISWSGFTTANGQAVAAGLTSVTLGPGGTLSVALVPNRGGTPVNSLYTVVYQLSDMVKTEYWSVPASSPATLADVRTTLGTSGSTAQMATQQYVNSALSDKATDSSVVHLSGNEAIAGVKQFSVSPKLPDPTQPTDGATKQYVDQMVQTVGSGSYLSTSGGTLSGPLTLSSDPAAPLQAATKHYADLWAAVKADLIGGLVPPAELGRGTPNSSTCLLGDQSWGPCSASGSSAVYINNSMVASPNFNVATPGPQSTFLNCTFQTSGSNVSLECPYGNTSSSFALGSRAVLNNQANIYGPGLQDFSLAGLRLPSGAGYAPGNPGEIGFDTSANMAVIKVSGVTQQLALTTSDISGRAGTATALAGTPAQCNGGFATGVQSNGDANCSEADVLELAESDPPPGLPNYGIFWFDRATHTPRIIANNGQVTQLSLVNVFNLDANTLEEYNGSNPQTFSVYGNRTDASNYERLRLGYDAAGGYFVLGADAAGSGTQRGIGFWLQGSLRWIIDAGFNFKPWSDNLKDIGAPSLRVRNLYLGSGLVLNSGTLSGVHGTTGVALEAGTVGTTTGAVFCNDGNGNATDLGCGGTVTRVNGTDNQISVNNPDSTPTLSFPANVVFPGSIAMPQVGVTESRVDGTVNTTLAASAFSTTCLGATGARHGCNIGDDHPEVLQAWPLLGSMNAEIKLMHGNSTNGVWWATVPIIASNDQIIGSGPVNSSGDASTGTAFRACDGEAACNGLYFPNKAPVPPTANASASTAAGSLSGNYYVRLVWLVNLNTAPDARPTGSQPSWPANSTVYAGYAVSDGTTNCAGSTPCTQVAIKGGLTTNGQHPNWTSTLLGQTNDNEVVWLNLGNFSGNSTTYGAPGLSMAGPEQGPINVDGTSHHSLAIPAVAVTSYPNCSKAGVTYTTGMVVLGPAGSNSHAYRAVGSGTTNGSSCNMSTIAGSQTQDGGASGLYWQEVGPPTNYLPVLGYIPYVSNSGGAETAQDTSGCSSTVQVGPVLACAVGATYTLSAYSAGGSALPLFDTTNPLAVTGILRNNNTGSSLQTKASRFENLTLDANDIAGEAELNLFGQELAGFYRVNALGGDECVSAAIGPGAQNGNLIDYVISDPASGNYQLQRVGGLCMDNRAGGSYKTVVAGTVTLYNNPPGSLAPADYYVVGHGANFVGSHAENAVDGFYCQGASASLKAVCSFSGVTSGSGPNTNTNTIHLGNYVDVAYASVKPGSATNSIRDDNVSPGGGNCNGNNSYCLQGSTEYHGGQQAVDVGTGGELVAGPLNVSGATTVSGLTVTGAANAPNPPAGDSSNRIATTAWVQSQTSALPWFTQPFSNGNGISFSSSSNKAYLYGVVLAYAVTTTQVTYYVATADNSGNTYDIGIYQGTAGGTNTLLAHIGPTAGTSFAPSTGWKTLNWTAPVTLQPGRYYLAITSSCTSSCAQIGSGSTNTGFTFDYNNALGVTNGGTLPASITGPADSYAVASIPVWSVH